MWGPVSQRGPGPTWQAMPSPTSIFWPRPTDHHATPSRTLHVPPSAAILSRRVVVPLISMTPSLKLSFHEIERG